MTTEDKRRKLKELEQGFAAFRFAPGIGASRIGLSFEAATLIAGNLRRQLGLDMPSPIKKLARKRSVASTN